jgi:hypothetical protein
MSEVQTTDSAYRTLYFLVRHGDRVAIVVALAPLIAGLWAYAAGLSIGYAVAGVFGAAFLYLVMRSYVELVRVIVDMLLPK